MTYSQKVLEDLKIKNPDQPEFIQAATEVLDALAPVVDTDPVYEKAGLLKDWLSPRDRLCSVSLGLTIKAQFM